MGKFKHRLLLIWNVGKKPHLDALTAATAAATATATTTTTTTAAAAATTAAATTTTTATRLNETLLLQL